MTTRRDFMLGIAVAGAMPLAKKEPAVDAKIEPFVGEHVYFLWPGDSYSIDNNATDQWEKPKKVTVIIEEIEPSEGAMKRARGMNLKGQIILRKPKQGG